ncbi:MAG: hypothetical protein EOO62_05135 [Hymenobacter sp.]|nr:MAG: hypothetical protein EOO62_05135 [Hymenobacter sp.]
MATTAQPDHDQNQPNDPAQLGGDQGPATTAADDSHDMSTIMADADAGRDKVGQGHGSTQGSDFDQQRRQGATNDGDANGNVGQGQGMGRTGTNGDEDRGYDQSGYRGGLGASGGREDHSDRTVDTERNPFVGGYDGGGTDRPDAAQTQNLGLNTPNPTGNNAVPAADEAAKQEGE